MDAFLLCLGIFNTLFIGAVYVVVFSQHQRVTVNTTVQYDEAKMQTLAESALKQELLSNYVAYAPPPPPRYGDGYRPR